jgi:hypothetical protein
MKWIIILSLHMDNASILIARDDLIMLILHMDNASILIARDDLIMLILCAIAVSINPIMKLVALPF